MKDRQWIVTTIAAIVLVVVAASACLMITDDYGLFRKVEGRSLPIYYGDRMGKALLNIRYVPANFNSLLIGPSSSVNWEPQTIMQGAGLRMYNESLEGGNASEEKLLVDRALAKGNFKLALIVLYPTMIENHDYNDAIDKVRWTQALGSLDAYVQNVLSEMTSHNYVVTSKQHAGPDGSHEMRNPRGRIFDGTAISFKEDPVGLRNLQRMVAELQSHRVRIVYVVPTVYEPVLEANRSGFDRFIVSMRSELPTAPLIDLTAPDYAGLRSNPDNYIDAFHVTPGGARQISQLLNARLRTALPATR